MKTSTLATLAALCVAPAISYAQWTTVPPNTTTNDNVGIGTTAPSFKLEVAGTTIPNKTIGINGIPMIYLPDQSSSAFIGSVAYGNGLRYMSSPSGKGNTVIGIDAGLSITTGESNTGAGYQALRNTTTAFANTAFGIYALQNSSTGGHNAAFGGAALQNNISGTQNSAVGSGTMLFNTSGVGNSGSGFQALLNNTTGYWNTAVGAFTMHANTTGNWNTVLGANANTIGGSLENATAIGARALVGKNNAISLGDTTKPTLVGIGTAYPQYQLDVRATANPVRFTGLQSGSSSDDLVTVDANGVLRRISNSGGGTVTNADQGVTLNGSTVQLGDICGKGGAPFKDHREINMNNQNLYFNSLEQGKLYMGAEQCKDLVTRLEIGAKGLDAINDYDTKRASTSGLRFTDLTATSEPVENKYKGVLSLDEDGDVIWVRECCDKGRAANDEVAELKAEMTQLKAELAELKSMLQSAQGNTLSDNAGTLQDMLLQNTPNPTSGSTRINYTLAGNYTDAFIAVYDMNGKMIRKIALQGNAGRSSVNIDLSAMAAGTYTYSLFANGQLRGTRKMQVN